MNGVNNTKEEGMLPQIIPNLYFCQLGEAGGRVLQRVGKTKFCHLADWTQFYQDWYLWYGGESGDRTPEAL